MDTEPAIRVVFSPGLAFAYDNLIDISQCEEGSLRLPVLGVLARQPELHDINDRARALVLSLRTIDSSSNL